jgi:succinate dehydrogenase subunit C
VSFRLYLLQRLTAALMLPLIAAHLATIVYATHKGLSAAEVLSRTRGSLAWASFYGLFVLLAATHGAIGLRVVVSEWTLLRGRALDALMLVAGIILALLGARAVYAVIAA